MCNFPCRPLAAQVDDTGPFAEQVDDTGTFAEQALQVDKKKHTMN